MGPFKDLETFESEEQKVGPYCYYIQNPNTLLAYFVMCISELCNGPCVHTSNLHQPRESYENNGHCFLELIKFVVFHNTVYYSGFESNEELSPTKGFPNHRGCVRSEVEL